MSPDSGVASYLELGHVLPATNSNFIFTALHVMQTRYSDENSVRLSVRPSVGPSV